MVYGVCAIFTPASDADDLKVDILYRTKLTTTLSRKITLKLDKI